MMTPPAAVPAIIPVETGRLGNMSVITADDGGLGTDTDMRSIDLCSDIDCWIPSLGPGDDGDPGILPATDCSRDCLASETGGGGGGANGGSVGLPNAAALDVTGRSC